MLKCALQASIIKEVPIRHKWHLSRKKADGDIIPANAWKFGFNNISASRPALVQARPLPVLESRRPPLLQMPWSFVEDVRDEFQPKVDEGQCIDAVAVIDCEVRKYKRQP